VSVTSFSMKGGGQMAFDNRVLSSLQRSASHFASLLGQPRQAGNDLIFSTKDIPFTSFKVGYDVVNKFLGKIYVLVAEARFYTKNQPPTGMAIELRYSGFFRKNKALFEVRSPKHGSVQGFRLVDKLNSNQRLLNACLNLDLECLRLIFDKQQETWKIQARPYGGSFVYIMLPPMRYPVNLPENHARLIVSAMKDMVHVIERTDYPKGLQR